MLTLATLTFLALLPAAEPAVQADIVIHGATLYDGTGQPGRIGDLAVRGDRIVAVGTFTAGGKPRIIDGNGLIVAPGFIDLHTHSDMPLTQTASKANLCYLLQGVTTVVTGNCGSGPADVADYFRKLESGGVGSNVIHQVPHNDVRRKVMGNANRLPTEEELKKMEALVDQGMKDGAWSLSTGLIYNPGTYARTDELIARYSDRPGWNGKDLATIATVEKKSPLEIVLEIERNGGAQIVNFGMSEEDVRLIMKQEFVATASDGSSQVPSNTVPHPRSYGCFARKIGRYAVAEKIITLEHAIRSASGLPADVLKLPDRGYLKPGYFADVVV